MPAAEPICESRVRTIQASPEGSQGLAGICLSALDGVRFPAQAVDILAKCGEPAVRTVDASASCGTSLVRVGNAPFCLRQFRSGQVSRLGHHPPGRRLPRTSPLPESHVPASALVPWRRVRPLTANAHRCASTRDFADLDEISLDGSPVGHGRGHVGKRWARQPAAGIDKAGVRNRPARRIGTANEDWAHARPTLLQRLPGRPLGDRWQNAVFGNPELFDSRTVNRNFVLVKSKNLIYVCFDIRFPGSAGHRLARPRAKLQPQGEGTREMLCNRMKSSQCLFLLVALLGAVLAGCGGDEPAPAPPPPPPPPPPAFVPVDVAVELGTSGETLTLQTTESGGFTRNGEAFASGTTVEAGGNTYRLVLTDGEWGAEYVAPRPWATALGRSGDALLISRREDGLYEAGDAVFSSGGTVTATNGNQYRLTLNADTNSWDVEYLPPDPTPILLGMSGETVLAERLEGGGYSVGGQRVVDGSTIMSASGNTYRLSMQDGVWTATFVPPPPVMVPLGDSGLVVTLQVREDGQFEKDGQLYLTGSKETVGGLTYRLELQNGMWTAVAEARQIMVTLGISGRTITILEHPDGRFTNEDGQPYLTGSTETVGDRTLPAGPPERRVDSGLCGAADPGAARRLRAKPDAAHTGKRNLHAGGRDTGPPQFGRASRGRQVPAGPSERHMDGDIRSARRGSGPTGQFRGILDAGGPGGRNLCAAGRRVAGPAQRPGDGRREPLSTGHRRRRMDRTVPSRASGGGNPGCR